MVLVAIKQEREKITIPRPNIRFNSKIAKLPTFDEDTNKVTGFVTVYKLYIRIRIKKILVKKQCQYIYTESW